MSLLLYLFVFVALLVIELFYFKVANYYNITDYPNHRSSHIAVTIRGGGVIFSVALLLSPVYFGGCYPYFLAGLFLISTISFIDDIKTIGNGIRIGFHLAGVALMLYQLDLFHLPYYLIGLIFVLIIGTINAVNFMDGINGITGGYGLITLAALYYINSFVQYTSANFLFISILSVIVFNFFNFRKKAKCFAGDVGSISLAFIIIFFLLQLLIKTNNLNYILLLLLYGLDTATTILFRLIRKENISQAHRSHFYQYLANHKKLPHLAVASVYLITQSIINLILLKLQPQANVTLIIVIGLSTVVFIYMRLITEGPARLLNKYY